MDNTTAKAIKEFMAGGGLRPAAKRLGMSHGRLNQYMLGAPVPTERLEQWQAHPDQDVRLLAYRIAVQRLIESIDSHRRAQARLQAIIERTRGDDQQG